MTALAETEHQAQDLHSGDIGPRQHLVQFYEDDRVFLDTLESFVRSGLAGGESVILIATREHLAELEDRMRHAGVSLNIARARYRYLTLDAEETLSKFMVRGWPDEQRFTQTARDLLRRAHMGSPHVRAFGEMVSLLWSGGLEGATIRLEQIWHELCQEEDFSLLCSYPQRIFHGNVDASIRDICAAHSRVISSLN